MKLLKFSARERYKSGSVLVLFMCVFSIAFPQGVKHYAYSGGIPFTYSSDIRSLNCC